MDLEATVLFKDIVSDTDLEDVEYRLQCCVNKWFFPEITSIMPEVHVSTVSPIFKFDIPKLARTPNFDKLVDRVMRSDSIPKPKSKKLFAGRVPRPIFVVSDLHLGDRGPRDNFTYMSNGTRHNEFLAFLDMVEEKNGRLIIAGDLFELWQSNMSLVLTSWDQLLHRLAGLRAIYILGNHDADLLHFCSNYSANWLNHPFFVSMVTSHTEYLGGKSFHIIHGHEVDKFCAGSVPGIGRISAIYTGLKEDRNGSPFLNKYRTVEAAVTQRLEKVSSIVRWFFRKPNRIQIGYSGLRKLLKDYDVVVSGHTHRAGQLYAEDISFHGAKINVSLPIYNAGTWAEATCSYVRIDTNGKVRVFDWIDGKGVLNTTELRVKV